MLRGNRLVAVTVLGLLAVAWLGLMWFFNLYDEFWWRVLSVAAAIPLLLWASAKSRTSHQSDDPDAEPD